jgi:2-dehydro-3-deoxy-D-arabinonate dehydratase
MNVAAAPVGAESTASLPRFRYLRVRNGDVTWFGVALPDGEVRRFEGAPFTGFLDIATSARAAGLPLTTWVSPWVERARPVRERFDELNRAPGSAPYLVTPFDPPEVWGAAFTYDTRTSEPLAVDDDFLRERRTKRVVVFFKTTPLRAVGPHAAVGSRSDTTMMIPEPELGVIVGGDGGILGYTVVNDVSSRDLPREDPLYVSYSKTFRRCLAFGPCIVAPEEAPVDGHWHVRCVVERNERVIWDESNTTRRRYRSWLELRAALFDHNDIADGTLYATGTVLTPPQTMHVREGDRLTVDITGIGSLANPVIDV